ncbi:MAG: hypothetical protein WCG26_00465 [Chloroflexales bacterium]
MTRAYVRRTRFEAALLAQEVVGAMALALGGATRDGPRTPVAPPSASVPTVPTATLLAEMGITL